MTENKRFYIDKSGDLYDKQNNELLMLDFGYEKSIYVNSVLGVLNQLHEENETLKKRLKEQGDNLKEYYYDENGEKIESFDNEKLLTSLLQDIINELQNGWFVAEFESDFNNEVDINTLRTYAKNFCMKVSLRRTKPREFFF